MASASHLLQRARVNLAEAQLAGATRADLFELFVSTLRGHSAATSVDRSDAGELLVHYGELFGTPGLRDPVDLDAFDTTPDGA